MSKTLVPCPACERHVRVSEARCPFCEAALPESIAQRAVPATTQRLSRAATFVFGAAALVASGCGTPANPDGGGGDDVVADMGGPMPLYGGPPVDAGVDDASDGGTNRRDSGGIMPLYGGPTPVDGG